MTTIQPIWFPAQRTLRTIVQALIVLVPVANGVAGAIVAYLGEQTDIVVHPTVFVWLNATIAITAVIMGLIARVMAVPGVNDILAKIGLGSVPKKDIPDDVSDLLRRDLR